MVSRSKFCSDHNAYGNHPSFCFEGLNLAKGKLNHYEKMRMRQRKKIWKMAAAHLEQKTHPARKT